ncbi:MAG: type II toxin-antitoxin system death-on-curing family toxin [Actinomycetota bacterium]|nr:type II toxin-antitoxin system death-on-curing family toxin [Actinomycetota bacterium]
MGITLSPRARRLPKGALRKLTRIFPSAQPEPAPVPSHIADEEPLRWELVGPERREIRLLTVEEICSIHEALEEDFASSQDPIVPPGVRDRNLLASAVARAATSFGPDRKYPTVEMACAASFHSLVHNHPFFNGNKRTALVSLLAQLDENDLVLTASEKDLFRFTLRTAQHRLVSEVSDRPDRESLAIARWIRSNSRPVERGERPMTWRKLRQHLRDFNCEITPAGGVGNRLNIKRVVARHRRFGIGSKTRVLQTQVAWSGDGTDADRSTIHMLRKNLELDDEHDVDSAMFYAGAKVDAFIIDYRRILKRLAKV